MTASFNARLSSKEKFALIATILSLTLWNHPFVGKAYAETIVQQDAPALTINAGAKIAEIENKNDQEIAKEQKLAFAKIDKKVKLVRTYLESKNSPLAPYTEIIIAQDDWKKILAISNAESNMGIHCYGNNCSGIFGYDARTGKYGLKTYKSKVDWMLDLQALIDQRYKNMSLDKMNGIYVQPRSASWYAASSKVYNDLVNIENKANNSVDEL